jgi:predicted RNase H-like HicB family nuclease
MTYYVLVENGKQGSYTATVLGWPDCTAQGATRQEALARLRQALITRLARAEIVPLEIEHPHPGHPWLKFAGMFKDAPLFDDVLAEIEAYRRELDADDAAI